MGFQFSSRGNWNKTESWLRKMNRLDLAKELDRNGQIGVQALRANTPIDSGATAAGWGYEIVRGRGTAEIHWTNHNTNSGVNIAIILQYGHGTGTGGYVAGRDYINPAIKPIFDKIADDVWKAVKSA